jgi:hypothetical protein
VADGESGVPIRMDLVRLFFSFFQTPFRPAMPPLQNVVAGFGKPQNLDL